MTTPNKPKPIPHNEPTRGRVNEIETILHYGNSLAEAACLRETVGLIDLSNRDRLCLIGADRHRFLNGQVTNNIRDLQPPSGCYALIVSNKGIVQGDANIFCLENELLLDLEPGQGKPLTQRLNGFIISDDVEIADAAAHYGLLSIQGPLTEQILKQTDVIQPNTLPQQQYEIAHVNRNSNGEIYAVNHPRIGGRGCDLFIANEILPSLKTKLEQLVCEQSGRLCGWQSLETLRIEAGLPRFPIDMEPTVLAPELGIEDRAIRYDKGCYIGQEIINRIKTIGKVNRRLLAFKTDPEAPASTLSGSAILLEGKPIGFITSAVFSEPFQSVIGFALVKTATLKNDSRVVISGRSEAESEQFEATLSPPPLTLHH